MITHSHAEKKKKTATDNSITCVVCKTNELLAELGEVARNFQKECVKMHG